MLDTFRLSIEAGAARLSEVDADMRPSAHAQATPEQKSRDGKVGEAAVADTLSPPAEDA